MKFVQVFLYSHSKPSALLPYDLYVQWFSRKNKE